MKEKTDDDLSSVAGHMVRGSAWMVAMRWSMRGIGLLSTVILVRLLTPADYGLVAMGVIILGFVQIFTQTGFDLALIQESQATKAHYDTVWTLEIFQGLIIALILFAMAPLASWFYQEPRVKSVIQVLALVPLIAGFTNIGIVEFRKSLNFAKEFRYNVYSRIFRSIIVVVLGFYLRNYWALVIASVSSAVVDVLRSYIMQPFRPWFSLSKFKDIWRFSQWMLVFNIGSYMQSRFDSFFVGRFAGPAAMGSYNIATEFASTPTAEVVLPLGRAIFPSYAKLADNMDQAGRAYLQVLAVVALFCIPAGVGFSAVANEMVFVVFGAKWASAAPLIGWLAITYTVSGITSTGDTYLAATGRARVNAILLWAQLCILVVAVLCAGYFGGVVAVAAARTIVAIPAMFAMFYAIARVGEVSIWRQLAVMWRSVIASLIMFCSIEFVRPFFPTAPALALSLEIALGAFVYLSLMFGLWQVSGKPAGAEKIVFEFCVRPLYRFRADRRESDI